MTGSFFNIYRIGDNLMKRKHLLRLVRSQVLSRRSIHSILKVDPSLDKLSSYSPEKITNEFNIPLLLATKIKDSFSCPKISRKIKEDENICQIITIFDETYPLLLKQTIDPPLVLYGIGNISLLNQLPIISIIGTRQPTDEAWSKLELIATPLIQNDWIVVSGLAKGIDSFAHKLTLNNSGKTIAVLGNGFNYVYPKENRGLLGLIKSRGLVITEYPPNTPPRKYQFPERNRIISGLSLATLVIEAKKRSGTLITVNQALDQGRDVYAVPGSPLHAETEGCHHLIQDGAVLVTSAQDILNNWPMNRQVSFEIDAK